jgi:pyruvate dehydrogenase E2 component (dihydrolipoamide acetyltransferase)
MATVIRMPEVMANAAEASIQTWLVKPGEQVVAGAPLAEVETEKAVVEYAAEASGTLLKVIVAEGVPVNVGDPIAVIGEPGESVDENEPVDAGAPADPEAPSAAPEPETAPESEPSPVASAPTELAGSVGPASESREPSSTTGRQFVSPLVRRLAKERGIDVATLNGTGPGGRVVRADLDRAPAASIAAPTEPTAESTEGFVDVPHTGMRRAIARRLTESKSTVPHFYVVADCRVDRLVQLRAEVNETAGVKVSLNDFVIKAAAGAFLDVPEANATWGDTAVRRYETVDMSVAVAVEGGLLTPVLRSVENLSLTQINAKVTELAGRARAGKIKPDELVGGSFAVSNLGMYGVTEFTAIINPPQAAILAVGAARQQPVVDNGELAVGWLMTVTLSADHRVLDGAVAAQWLAAFVKRIENPVSTLL